MTPPENDLYGLRWSGRVGHDLGVEAKKDAPGFPEALARVRMELLLSSRATMKGRCRDCPGANMDNA